jgi:hypothetical protein
MSETILSPKDQSQPAQIIRHISLGQLEALHAIPSVDSDGGQTSEGCATTPGDENIAADNNVTAADG